tara:strand:+ start:2024 stop:2170 length:147 start_codon:yes stop_codon:yes gene_type:complete
MLIPIFSSLFIIALCIGAAPLHFGSSEAWIFINPNLGIFKKFLGISFP